MQIEHILFFSVSTFHQFITAGYAAPPWQPRTFCQITLGPWIAPIFNVKSTVTMIADRTALRSLKKMLDRIWGLQQARKCKLFLLQVILRHSSCCYSQQQQLPNPPVLLPENVKDERWDN
jgi:hypothetical protein